MKPLVMSGAILTIALVLASGCSGDVNAERGGSAARPADANTVAAAESKPAAVATGDPTIASGAVAAAPAFREVTIPAGTRLLVRLEDAVGSKTSSVEDRVDGRLNEPVKLKQTIVLPEGSEVHGEVTAAEPAGKVKGRARVALRFRQLQIGRDTYPIVADVSRLAPATKRQDAEKIALPAVGGAIVGALIDGKKGAAIGAAAGGGAGTAVVLSTSGKEVSIPRGSIVTLRLQQPVTIRIAN
jgi:hypothetical protein